MESVFCFYQRNGVSILSHNFEVIPHIQKQRNGLVKLQGCADLGVFTSPHNIAIVFFKSNIRHFCMFGLLGLL